MNEISSFKEQVFEQMKESSRSQKKVFFYKYYFKIKMIILMYEKQRKFLKL